MPINYGLRNAHFSKILTDYSITPFLHELLRFQKYINNMAKRQITVKLRRLTRSLRLIRIHLWSSKIVMDIHWCTYENLMVIFQQKRGLHVHQPIPAVIGVVREEGERNPQSWTDAHKENKCAVMGVLYTIENNSDKYVFNTLIN